MAYARHGEPLRDLFRTHARHRAASIDELPFDPPCPDDADARERIQAAWDAIAQLTDDERAIVHLVCFEEKTYREAAGALGVSENTVRMRLHRIREKLRAARDEGERAADQAMMMKEAQR